MAKCVQCGHCCRSGPCSIAVRLNTWRTPENGMCECLEWTGTHYDCKAIKEHPEWGDSIGGIGSGCSSSMFNTDRINIPSPEEILKRSKI